MKYWYNDFVNVKTEKGDRLPHCLIINPTEQKKFVQIKKTGLIYGELALWLNDNLGSNQWDFYKPNVFVFTTEEAAMAFKLRWS